MPSLLLTARLLLALVFGVAGVSKILDPKGTRRALAEFGLPTRLAPPVAVALPLAEVAIGVALVFRSTAALASVGALALLGVFCVAMVRSLARGERPDCHCFGQLHSAPVGWKTLTRNGLLAAVAGSLSLAGWSDPGPSPVAWLAQLSGFERFVAVSLMLGLAMLVAQSLMLLALLRQGRRTEAAGARSAVRQGPGLDIDAPAPDFALRSLEGREVSSGDLRAAGRPVLLLFTDPGCQPCTALLPEVGRWQRELAGSMTLALISTGSAEANRAKLAGRRLDNVLVQDQTEVAAAYQVRGTPSAVLVRADGTIGSALAQGEVEIRQLVASSIPVEAPVSEAGGSSPTFSLPDLDGTPTSLEDFRGQSTLLLFWSPSCGFCQQMLADLRAWEQRTERPRLLLVSSGTAEVNRAQGLESKIVLDPSFSVAPRYGVSGTPSAVLVDPDGRVVGDVAAGTPEVLARLGRRPTPDTPPAADVVADPLCEDEAYPRLTSLPEGARPRKRDCVTDELLSDATMILYNGCSNRVHTLNPAAALVWELCDGEHEVEDIVAEARQAFPATSDADGDVRALLDRLLQTDMIRPEGVDMAVLLAAMQG